MKDKLSQRSPAPLKRYRVIWAPEGRTIVIVYARTPQAARRRAPMPFRRYPGEIYAEETLE